MWTAVALLGAVVPGVLAPAWGAEISAVRLMTAALGSYAIAHRFGSASSPGACCGPTTAVPLRRNGWRTASTNSRPTAGCCSATPPPPTCRSQPAEPPVGVRPCGPPAGREALRARHREEHPQSRCC
ncbi:hypothetical protein [Streptomyces aurantiogriseus]|uniref:hypothetical protein n=1 Tax=Streptomyces aurantiogriseus TaxID=66870 RepID=UPI003570C6C8